jgi:hypothetical protein
LRANHFKDQYHDKLKKISLGKFIPQLFYQDILTLKNISDQTYANWLKDYLQGFVKEPIKNIIIKKIRYNYSLNGFPNIKNEETILNMNYE